MNELTEPKTTTTTLIVAVSTSSETAPTTASKSDNNPAMSSRVPLLTAINCGRLNHINEQSDTSKHKKDLKSILGTGHSQTQPGGLYLFAQNRHSHKHMKTSVEKSVGPRVNGQTSIAKDHKLHYQEEFNKMRERLFRLLSKVPIQVETVNSDYEPGNSSSATPSSSSSSSSQSQSFKKINRKPLIIKYYNERSLTDILDQHFGCSLIKHNFEHGVPLDAHLLKLTPTTTTSFTDANSVPNQCNCFNPSHRPHNLMDTPPTDNDGRAPIYTEELSHRSSIQTTQYDSSAQVIYNETGQHSQVTEYRGFQASGWEMQLPAVYCETTRDTSLGNKSSVHDHQSRSSSGAHKEAKYNGRLCSMGSNQRSSAGSSAGIRRQKRSSSSTSIMASRSSCVPGRSAEKQHVGPSRGTGTTEPSLTSNDPSADSGNSSMYASASDIKRMADKTTSYLESAQTAENFALSTVDSFASGGQLEVVSDLGGAVSLNTTTDGANFVPHLFDNYQQYHQNHNHHQNHHQHPQQHQQRHQTDLSNLYSSPTGSGNYQPTGADPATGSQLVVAPAEGAQQIISFSQHQPQDSQSRPPVSIEPAFNQRHQQQNRQVDPSYNAMSDSSTSSRLLVDGEPLGAYYQANGYQQPVEVVQPPENTWQQLCQPMLASTNNGSHLGPDEQAHLQQQMIDQQQHRLQNNNGFITSESYTEHDIGFYLAPNANYVVYADCQQTALNGSSMENLILTPHYHDMSQIHTDQHNHHHHLNHHSISRID